MAEKLRIAIVGAGNLASALAVSLDRAGYRIEAVIVGSRSSSLTKARRLAKQVNARSVVDWSRFRADVVWFCVPDSEIARAARSGADKIDWSGKVALHSSGALSSDELAVLRKRGARVASIHPMMTFVRGCRPPFAAVPFAIEGDPAAVRVARRIVGDLGGVSHAIRKSDKAAYHAWGTFASPLFTALLATSESVALLAGVKRKAARRRMIPILLQTLANYATSDAEGAFSGPIVRGDLETVQRHLRVLRKIPPAAAVYVALARAAVQYLPARNKNSLRQVLDSQP
jgi:predicted short-subunit dehydrogenase-like oxidoreductase (DUF2520 family)